MPRGAVVLLRWLPAPVTSVGGLIARLYVTRVRLGPHDPEQVQWFLTSFRQADLTRNRATALALSGYRLDEAKLTQIRVPVMVVGASQDRLHDQAVCKRIATGLPLAAYRNRRVLGHAPGGAGSDAG